MAAIAAVGSVALGVAPLAAQASFSIDIPRSTLSMALAALARQLHVDIGGSDPDLPLTITHGVHGRRSAPSALKALLAGTQFTFAVAAPGVYRIVRRPPPARALPPPPQPVAAPRRGDSDIVVLGGKRTVSLADYPGTAIVISPAEDVFGPNGSRGREWLLGRTAVLQSTELGPGRNKLFIRGVADSSFTGPTQSTASTYFGDVRTGYNGPYPNLNLYDVERVEVLEGPQGTLYGAGSIGGIIRLTPAPPRLSGTHASFDLGASTTHHGAAGSDQAAMINLVPIESRVGLRLVGYRSVDGGYIDDPGRSARNINGVRSEGGRLALRLAPGNAWTIDASYLLQASRQPDLQYAQRGGPQLQRASAIAQPFNDRYQLGRATIAHDWRNGISLAATYGRIRHRTQQRYDVTFPGLAPTAYDERNNIHLKTYEARLSQSRASGFGWVAGITRLVDRTAISRTFGPLVATRDIIGVTNRTRESAIFGELTVPVTPGFALTGGARYTDARMDGEPSINPLNRDYIRGRTSRRFDPELGFSWKVAPRLSAYAEYQQGFRTGGLAVARGIGRVATYEADQIRVGEAGLRLLRMGDTGLSATAAVSYTRWTDIQADLVSRFGFPYTTNVGDGHIMGLEASLDWAFGGGFRATAATFVNRSRLDRPAPDFVSSGSRPLPATPRIAATTRLEWRGATGIGTIRLGGEARYISHSRLGVGPVLDLRYGNYVQTGLAAALARGPLELSLRVDNVLDSRASRFAIGNPFGIQFGNEFTPLRPRTLRVGLSARY